MGYEHTITLRGLGHCHATWSAQGTRDAAATRAALGHSDSQTTQRYLSATLARTASAASAVESALGAVADAASVTAGVTVKGHDDLSRSAVTRPSMKDLAAAKTAARSVLSVSRGDRIRPRCGAMRPSAVRLRLPAVGPPASRAPVADCVHAGAASPPVPPSHARQSPRRYATRAMSCESGRQDSPLRRPAQRAALLRAGVPPTGLRPVRRARQVRGPDGARLRAGSPQARSARAGSTLRILSLQPAGGLPGSARPSGVLRSPTLHYEAPAAFATRASMFRVGETGFEPATLCSQSNSGRRMSTQNAVRTVLLGFSSSSGCALISTRTVTMSVTIRAVRERLDA